MGEFGCSLASLQRAGWNDFESCRDASRLFVVIPAKAGIQEGDAGVLKGLRLCRSARSGPQ